MKATSLILYSVLLLVSYQASLTSAEHHFGVDVSALRMNEMATNIDDMKVAVMGMAEYIQEINKNVQDVKTRLTEIEKAKKTSGAA